jgi:uncharacterized protein (DUF58 family)
MYRRLVSWMLWLGGLAALGLSIYGYCAPPAGPALAALESNIEARNCLAGQATPIAVRLHNALGRPVRIVGVEEC